MPQEEGVDKKKLCTEHCINVVGVQETKMTILDLFLVHSIWGNNQFDVASSGARGRSGGLVTIWDPNVFKKSRLWCTENLIIVEGEEVATENICYLVNVYAPQDRNRKKELWGVHFEVYKQP